jgi:membrane protein
MVETVSDAGEPGQPQRSRMDRVRAGKQHVADRVQDTRDRLERTRSRSSAVDAAFKTIERDAEVGGGVLAAAVGFRIFLFLVPYVFVFVAGFGVATDAANQSAQSVAHDAGVRGLTARAISGAADMSGLQRFGALVVGGLATFLAARSLYKTLRISHALVWQVPAGRSARTNRGALVIIGFLTGAFVIASLIGDARHDSALIGLVLMVVALMIPVAIWTLASWWLPHDDRAPWWAFLPGAVLVGLGIGLLHIVTVYWIAREVESKSDTYGAIGTAVALLLWAYLLGRLVVGSAALNASLWRRQESRSVPSSTHRVDTVDTTNRG